MGKRQLAALETRRKLIQAAEKLIRERGFDHVSVSDIAAEAGVAKGSFYTYFQRKEDVVYEIAQDQFATAEERAREIPDVTGQVWTFLEASMEYIQETGLHVCQQWLRNVADQSDLQGKEKLRYDLDVLRKLLQEAAERGELRRDTPAETLARCIAAQYYGAVSLWAISNGEQDPMSILRTYAEGALPGLIQPWRQGKE